MNQRIQAISFQLLFLAASAALAMQADIISGRDTLNLEINSTDTARVLFDLVSGSFVEQGDSSSPPSPYYIEFRSEDSARISIALPAETRLANSRSVYFDSLTSFSGEQFADQSLIYNGSIFTIPLDTVFFALYPPTAVTDSSNAAKFKFINANYYVNEEALWLEFVWAINISGKNDLTTDSLDSPVFDTDSLPQHPSAVASNDGPAPLEDSRRPILNNMPYLSVGQSIDKTSRGLRGKVVYDLQGRKVTTNDHRILSNPRVLSQGIYFATATNRR